MLLPAASSVMPQDLDSANERTCLLYHVANGRRLSQLVHDEEANSIVNSVVGKDEEQMAESTVGERLPYKDYTTID